MAKHPSIQNLDRTFGWITLCALIYALSTAWYSWTDERANYLSTLTTVTALEVKALDNYFSHLESDLKELGEDLTQNGDRIDLANAYTLVKKFKEVHSELFNVTLISPTGQVLLTAKNPPGTNTATLAKEPSFMAFIDEMKQDKASSIGQPLVSVINKVVIVPVRYALKDKQGNLIYIVSANLPHEHLRSFWEDAPITSQAAIGLMRDNGYLLSRFPVPAGLNLEQIYGRPRTGALINHLQKEGFPEQGHIQGPTSLDGTDFMSVFRRLPHHPATLFVAMPMAEVRAGWLERVSTTYIAILLMYLGGAAAYRYARRRQLVWNSDQSRQEEDRQGSAAELLASETRFRTFFTHNNAIILQINPVTGQILDANAAASQFYGWSHHELLSKSILDINQLDAQEIALERQAAVQEQRSYFVFPHRLSNGDIRTVEVHSTPIDIGGKAVLVSIIHDITDRTVIEARVRSLLEEQKAILDSDLVGIVKVQQRKVVWANDTFHTLLGYSPGELVGQPTRVCYPTEESYALFGERAYPVFQTGNAYRLQLQLRRKDKTLGWYSLRTAPLRPGGDVLIGVLIDITQEILSAEKIAALMREQKAILNNELVGIVTVRDRRIVWANPAFEHMLGYQSGELAGTLTQQNYPSEETYQAFGDAAYPVLAAGKVFRTQIAHVRKDGQHVWLDVSGALMDRQSGQSLWGFIDITQRKQLEDAVALNEKRMELALDGGELATWDWHIPSGALVFNSRWAEMQGFTLEELAPRVESWETRVHPDDLPGAKASLDLHFRGVTAVYESEHRVLHKDGHWVWVQGRGKVLERDSNANPVRALGTAVDISDRKRAEFELRESESRFHAMADGAPILIWMSGLDKLCNWFNKVWLDFTGRSLEQELGNGWTQGVHPEDFQRCLDTYMAAFDERREFTMEYRLRRHDGAFRWVEDHGIPRKEADGTFLGYIGTCVDITERLLSAEKIDALMQEQKAILNNELVGIMTAKDRVMGWVNPAFEKLFGYERDELVGLPVRLGHCSDEAYEAFGRDSYSAIASGQSYRAEYEYQRKDGSRFFADVSGSMLSPATGEMLWCFIDVTARKRNEREIEQLAFYDVLTALPNRRLLLDRLAQAIIANKRSDRHGAVIFLDLDNFKSLNDTHGHGVGDLLLVEVADRLKGCVRQIDTVSRFGGDEFVVLLCDLASDKAESTSLANVIAEKIRSKLAEPYGLTVEPQGEVPSRIEHRCTASIGVIVFASDELSQDEILKSADVAMYQAKDAGRNSIRFHVESADAGTAASGITE